MPDSIYNFAFTFSVKKRGDSKLTDMELAQVVHKFLQMRLLTGVDTEISFITESIHPIMVGPKGGTEV